MVYVKLLKDVAEGGTEWTAGGPRNAAGQRAPLKVVGGVEYRKGTVVTMHEEGAKKWISRGLCEVVAKPAA